MSDDVQTLQTYFFRLADAWRRAEWLTKATGCLWHAERSKILPHLYVAKQTEGR